MKAIGKEHIRKLCHWTVLRHMRCFEVIGKGNIDTELRERKHIKSAKFKEAHVGLTSLYWPWVNNVKVVTAFEVIAGYERRISLAVDTIKVFCKFQFWYH